MFEVLKNPKINNKRGECMNIPERNQYMKEVEKIENEEIRSSLIELYDHLTGKIQINNVNKQIKELLCLMFTNEKRPLVPLEFFDTILSRVIFSIMYELPKLYTVKDIIELTGYRKQNIHKDIKNEKLKGEMKNGEYVFTEEQVNEYLIKKGFNTEKKCEVDGCTNKFYAKGYCQKHYRALKRAGKI